MMRAQSEAAFLYKQQPSPKTNVAGHRYLCSWNRVVRTPEVQPGLSHVKARSSLSLGAAEGAYSEICIDETEENSASNFDLWGNSVET